jgi:hypothetical protein
VNAPQVRNNGPDELMLELRFLGPNVFRGGKEIPSESHAAAFLFSFASSWKNGDALLFADKLQDDDKVTELSMTPGISKEGGGSDEVPL